MNVLETKDSHLIHTPDTHSDIHIYTAAYERTVNQLGQKVARERFVESKDAHAFMVDEKQSMLLGRSAELHEQAAKALEVVFFVCIHINKNVCVCILINDHVRTSISA